MKRRRGGYGRGLEKPDDEPRARPPRQLPGDVRGFVNRISELEQLDRLHTTDDGSPHAVGISTEYTEEGAFKGAHIVRDREYLSRVSDLADELPGRSLPYEDFPLEEYIPDLEG